MKHLRATAIVVSLTSSVVACASDAPAPAVCDEVAAQLEGCNAEQSAALLESCRAQPEDASLAALTSEDIGAACRPADDGKADAYAGATAVCVAAMYGLKWTITALSPTTQPLSDDVKKQLRPTFGALVDTARITTGGVLPPGIKLGDRQLSITPGAMTFGNKIFIEKEWGATISKREMLLTTVHEMQHVQQVARAGGFLGFAREYCRETIAVNFDYYAIPLEINAASVEDVARLNLQKGCTTAFCK